MIATPHRARMKGCLTAYIAFAFLFTLVNPVRAGDLGQNIHDPQTTPITPPTTALKALENFKYALDHGLFLQESFYTVDNLNRFFGNTTINWYNVRPNRKMGRVTSDYLDLFLLRGIVDAAGNEIPHGKKRGGGVLSESRTNRSITVDTIIALFGKPPRTINPYENENSEHPSALEPRTHALGNLAIEYEFDEPQTKSHLRCAVNGNGTIKACSFDNIEN